MKKIILIILCLVVSIFIVYQPIKKQLMLSPVISTGVSTDGRYVITAHASRKTIHFSDTYVVLWDTQEKTKKILAIAPLNYLNSWKPMMLNEPN